MLPNITIPSPTRTYIVPLSKHDTHNNWFTVQLVRFRLPESYNNTLHDATWYYYNKVDASSAWWNAFPAEIIDDIKTI